MTFKQLTDDLLREGWRAYWIDDVFALAQGNNLEILAIRNLIEVQVFEGQKVVFVRDTKPKK
jgi:hypothetical protein